MRALIKQACFLLNTIVLTVVLYACGSTPKSEEKLSSENTTSSQCYGSYTDKDSVFMKLSFTGEAVKGDLTYKLYEKDKNFGTIDGVLRGDTIIGTYKFSSEGKISEREVAFLKQGEDLVEGFAPMNDNGTRFKNEADLDFTGIVLQSDDCHE
ncbi:MAG: hypothetical protein ABI477_09730 [Chryseolinea sp.]